MTIGITIALVLLAFVWYARINSGSEKLENDDPDNDEHEDDQEMIEEENDQYA